MVPQLDGTTLVGGSFSAYSSGEVVSGLVRLSPTGEVERRLHALQSGLEYVNEVISVADGSRLLGGNAAATRLALRNYPCLYRLGSDWVVHPLDVYDVTSVDEQRIAVFPTDDGRLLLSNVTGYRGSMRLSGLVMVRPEPVSPGPAIQALPQGAIAREGTTVVFAVKAVGEGTLTYQWLKDGSVIPDAAGPTLTLPQPQPADSGAYTVVVSNDFGKATSSPAALVVHDEEQIAYADWAEAHFTPAELADPAISGPVADPDRSGFANLLRYAFKLPARGPIAAAPVLPTTAILYGSTEYFAVSFRRKTYAPGLRYVVEGMDDPAGVWSEVREYLPGYPEKVVASDIDPMKYSVRRFLRVRVEQVP